MIACYNRRGDLLIHEQIQLDHVITMSKTQLRPLIHHRNKKNHKYATQPMCCCKMFDCYLNKKLSCCRETARRFVSLNILLSHSKVHSRSFEMTV